MEVSSKALNPEGDTLEGMLRYFGYGRYPGGKYSFVSSVKARKHV
jgi:hypothetical protein